MLTAIIGPAVMLTYIVVIFLAVVEIALKFKIL